MKIKVDENMPHDPAELLRSAGHNAETVPEEGLSGAEDPLVIKRAAEEGCLLMTFDLDFGDVRSYPIGTHAGIVVFRLHDQRWAVLREPAGRLIASGLLERLSHGLAIVDESRIRLRSKENDND
ncbi:MAG: DUF5615 family PIN-like protein [bacterium]